MTDRTRCSSCTGRSAAFQGLPVQLRTGLPPGKPLARCRAAAVQQDGSDLGAVTHRRGQPIEHILEDARCIRVNHPPIAEGTVVAPHRGEILLRQRQAVFVRRRPGHVKVVAFDQAVLDARG